MKGKRVDLVGMRYGKLVVLRECESKSKRKKWLCRCDCGSLTEVRTDALRNKLKPTRSCGCIKKNYKDLTGRRFGRLRVIEDDGERSEHGKVKWKCVCDCGSEAYVTGSNLQSGQVKSCGCLSSTSSNLLGKKYGKLTVTKQMSNSGRSKQWLCVCECGGKVVATTNHLTTGNTKSCGCISAQGKVLTGRKVGMLLVKRDTGKRTSNGSRVYECLCKCGRTVHLESSKLRESVTKSCGCLRMNPNLTDQERMRKHRYSIKDNKYMYKVRKKAFERDGYACQVCGDRNGNGKKVVLNAHHLDGWNWCVEKRFEVDNLTTLCNYCHRDFHDIYGRGNNTREQFEEYLKKVLA